MAAKLQTSDFRLSGLSPSRAVLPNEVVFLGKETRTTPSVAINVAMRAGSACDPIDAPGATWLLSRVIDRGTATRSAAEIADELDGRGISLTVTVNRHVLSLVCTCLTEDFEAVLALIGDVLIAPSLPEGEIVTRKKEVITSIRQDDDNPFVRAGEALMALLYPDGHPYGRRIKGSIEAVDALTRDRLATLHRSRFAPGALSVVIVGDVEVARAQDVTARVLSGWSAPLPSEIRVADPPAAARRQRLVIPMMNKAQADLAYGFTTIRRADPAYYALLLANHVFGQYSIGGRLGESIREHQGMAYYAGSSLDATPINAPLVIRAGVSPANVDRALASIDDEVRRLAADGVTEKEIEDSRRYLIGALPRSLETNAAIAVFLQQAEFFGLGLDYDVRLPDLLRAVTVDEANDAIRRIFDEQKASVVIAGPYGE